MPFFHGSISASWYRAGRPAPPDARERYARNIARYSFKPINADKGEKDAFGWVDPRNILADSLNWDQLAIGPYLFLGFRVDRKSVPPALLKAHIRETIRQTMREKKKASLSRSEKKIIQDKVTADLLRISSPSVAIHEAVWNTATSDVFFGSSSRSLNESFMELFLSTFDIELFPYHPLARVQDTAAGLGTGGSVDALRPSFWGLADQDNS